MTLILQFKWPLCVWSWVPWPGFPFWLVSFCTLLLRKYELQLIWKEDPKWGVLYPFRGTLVHHFTGMVI
jgi:hypothetical protein